MASVKKILVLFVSLLMILSLAACSKEEEEGPTKAPLNKGDANCNHSWTQWELTKASTCTKKGTQYRACQLCGKEEQENVPAHGHMFYGDECNECGRAAIECDHAETEMVVMSVADCTNRGVTREICNDCMTVVDVHYEKALGHGTTKTVVIYQSSCTEDGEEQEICTVCGGVAQVTYPQATGHNLVYHDYQSATCTEDGWYSYYSCEHCEYLEGYEVISATGHSYYVGTCNTCAQTDPAFQLLSRPQSETHMPVMPQPQQNVLPVGNALVERYTGEITQADEVHSYPFTAQIDGVYSFALSNLGSGHIFWLNVKNAQGEILDYYSYCYEGNWLVLGLSAGEYTVEVCYCYDFGTYELVIGHQKPNLDISGYDVVNDSMEFAGQHLYYSFTPTVTGKYYFYLSGLLDNVYLDVSVLTTQHQELYRSYYCYNADGVLADELEAGETYLIRVASANAFVTPVNLHIDPPGEPVDMTGYGEVSGSLYYTGQLDTYTFVADSVEYNIVLSDFTNSLYLYLYDSQGQTLNWANIWNNGEGLMVSGLEIGQTYTLQVGSNYGATAYTLRLYKPRTIMDISVNMGIQDVLVYDGQRNAYRFTADRAGDFYLAIKFTDNQYASVSLYVYDADGNYVCGDSYFYAQETLWIREVSIGDVYYIHVDEYYDLVEYIIALQ